MSSQHEMDGNGVRNNLEAILFTYIHCTIQVAPRNILNVFVFSLVIGLRHGLFIFSSPRLDMMFGLNKGSFGCKTSDQI